MFFGELLSLIVALSWTATALFAEVGSKRMGSLPFNAVRMALSLCFLALTLWLTMGVPWPRYADGNTWLWLLLSGVIGYVIGDYCLMQGYIIIGSRFGQLFMTLSAPTAAILGRLFIGEQMGGLAIAGMVITLSGIAISVLSKQEKEAVQDTGKTITRPIGNQAFPRASTPLPHTSKIGLKLPARGVLYAAMAGTCQGAGLVLSKIGLEHYDAALALHEVDVTSVADGAILPIPLSLSIPFASTMIRGLMGFAGFMLLLMLSKEGTHKLRNAIGDRKALWCALASMLFGPFLGVSLSLMATLYTSTGIAQTLFSLTPILIIAPAALLFHQKVTLREVLGAAISVTGVCLFFI